MRSKALVFALGLVTALATPVLLGVVNDVLPAAGLVAVYAALGGLCAWLLVAEERRPVGVGLAVGGGLFVAGLFL